MRIGTDPVLAGEEGQRGQTLVAAGCTWLRRDFAMPGFTRAGQLSPVLRPAD